MAVLSSERFKRLIVYRITRLLKHVLNTRVAHQISRCNSFNLKFKCNISHFYVRQQVPECPVDRERLDPEKVIYFSVALRAGVQAKQGINLLAYQHDVSIAIFLSHSRHL